MINDNGYSSFPVNPQNITSEFKMLAMCHAITFYTNKIKVYEEKQLPAQYEGSNSSIDT